MKAYLRAALRDEWDGLDRITRDIRPADLVTLTNALAGFAAIAAATRGATGTASILVMVGVLLDGADGAVARRFGGGPLGGFLDSLADVITFAIAPAVILSTTGGIPFMFLAGFFVVCAMMRLARFEALREKAPRGYFSGMSTPGGALSVVGAHLAGLPMAWQVAIALVASVTMVSRIRYPKLRGGLGVAAVLILVFVLGAWTTPLREPAILALMGFMGAYLVGGPFYVLLRTGPPATTDNA